MRKNLNLILLNLFCMLWVNHALAETCSVVVTGVIFGNYDASSNSDSTGNVAVTCVALIAGTASYTISLSKGNGSFATRQLKAGSNALNYNVYSNNGRTTIWGDGTSSTATVSDSYGILLVPVTRNYTAYARIPSGQNPYVGNYTDTLDVTVVY